jgi:hypothetical protein
MLIYHCKLTGVFLHDFRVKAEGVKVKTTRQVKPSNLIKDTFYWPDMNVSLTTCYLFKFSMLQFTEKRSHPKHGFARTDRC